MVGKDVAQLLEDADLEIPALADKFLQPIALLPPMQTVLHPAFLDFNIGRTGGFPAKTGAQLVSIGVKDGWNVIQELSASEGAPRLLFGIGVIQLAPAGQDGCPASGEEFAQGD
jgi:hypothetical protein